MKTLLQNVRGMQVLLLAGLLVLGTSVAAAAPTGSAPSFAAAKSYATGRAVSVAIGDLNGDGKPDLATTSGSHRVVILPNRGSGTFGAKHEFATGSSPASVAVGDLNGDGKADLVTGNVDTNTVSVLLNTGDLSFEAKVDYPTGREPGALVLADLNGDGTL